MEIDTSIPVDYMSLTRSKIEAVSVEGSYYTETSVIIGQKLAIPMKAGKYRVSASLGTITSKEIEVDVAAGQLEKVTFYFGKET